MKELSKKSGWAKRGLALLSATAVALGLMSLAPATAQAADFKQSISGKVSGPKGAKIGGQKVTTEWGDKVEAGSIAVYKGKDCEYLEEGLDYTVSWSGKNYTVSLKKAGKYKISYNDMAYGSWGYAEAPKSAPWGVAPTFFGKNAFDCKSASLITVGNNKKVKGKNISAKAYGALEVINTGLKYTAKVSDSLMVVNTKSNIRSGTMWGKPVAKAGEVWKPSNPTVLRLAPGNYKLAKVRSQENAYDLSSSTISEVFGSSSKNIKKGKTITIKAAKAVRADFKKGKAKTGKAFPVKATVSMKSSFKVGQSLNVKVKGFPKGTKFKYEWFADGEKIKKATKQSLKIDKKLKNKTVEVAVYATKPGYVSKSESRFAWAN